MNFDSSTGYKVSLSKLFNQPVHSVFFSKFDFIFEITVMSKNVKFRVYSKKMSQKSNKTEFRKNRLYICRFRSSLLFKTNASSRPLRESEKSAPEED